MRGASLWEERIHCPGEGHGGVGQGGFNVALPVLLRGSHIQQHHLHLRVGGNGRRVGGGVEERNAVCLAQKWGEGGCDKRTERKIKRLSQLKPAPAEAQPS